jgi:hypothetical protein
VTAPAPVPVTQAPVPTPAPVPPGAATPAPVPPAPAPVPVPPAPAPAPAPAPVALGPTLALDAPLLRAALLEAVEEYVEASSAAGEAAVIASVGDVDIEKVVVAAAANAAGANTANATRGAAEDDGLGGVVRDAAWAGAVIGVSALGVLALASRWLHL